MQNNVRTLAGAHVSHNLLHCPALASDQIFYTVFTFFDDLKLSHQGGGAPTRNPHTAPYAARFEAMFGTDNASHMMV